MILFDLLVGSADGSALDCDCALYPFDDKLLELRNKDV